jgi:hypothetical protein
MGRTKRTHATLKNRDLRLGQEARREKRSASRATALQGRAPWVVKAAALESAAVRDEAQSRRRRKPLPENPDQQASIFQ